MYEGDISCGEPWVRSPADRWSALVAAAKACDDAVDGVNIQHDCYAAGIAAMAAGQPQNLVSDEVATRFSAAYRDAHPKLRSRIETAFSYIAKDYQTGTVTIKPSLRNTIRLTREISPMQTLDVVRRLSPRTVKTVAQQALRTLAR